MWSNNTEGMIQAAIAAKAAKEKYFKENPIPHGYHECPRCKGMGKIPQYMHRHQGTCFMCEGKRIIKTS